MRCAAPFSARRIERNVDMSKASKWIVWAFVAASFVVPGVVAAAQQGTPAASPAVSEQSLAPTGDELVLAPSARCTDPCISDGQCRDRCGDELAHCVGTFPNKHCIFE
jgi:hypothetical protein